MNPIDIVKTKAVDQDILKAEFQNYLPKRFDIECNKAPSADREKDEKELYEAFLLDRIDFHYRRYLKGTAKTLHQVFSSLRELPKERFFEAYHICNNAYCIAVVNEFYELCTRHESARAKMLKLAMKLHGTPILTTND